LNLIQKEKSPQPLLRNVVAAAGMFNRQGDSIHQANFESRRMLDDVTGPLFLLALFYGLIRFRERAYGLAVAGFAVFCLPAVLSVNGDHAGRMLGATPFIAYLVGLLLMDTWDWWAASEGKNRTLKRIGAAGVGLLLAAAALENFQTYFFRQVLDPICLGDFSWAETRVGRLASRTAGGREVFLLSRFYGNPTVDCLAYPVHASFHLLDMARLPRRGEFAPDKGFVFFLDELKMGDVEYLQAAYPGGQTFSFENPTGQTTVYAYQVDPASLQKLRPGTPRVDRGLKGVYSRADKPNDPPFLSRLDPVINFTFRDLPSTSAPLRIHWTGRLRVPREGLYEFLVVTLDPDQARLSLDRKVVADWELHPTVRQQLGAGNHLFELEFQKGDGIVAAVNLLWKKPGDSQFQFIPNDAWGPIKSR
jgi:hypothetical protein